MSKKKIFLKGGGGVGGTKKNPEELSGGSQNFIALFINVHSLTSYSPIYLDKNYIKIIISQQSNKVKTSSKILNPGLSVSVTLISDSFTWGGCFQYYISYTHDM